MLLFELAEFLLLKPARSVALLLRRRIVLALAFRTYQCYNLTHIPFFLRGNP